MMKAHCPVWFLVFALALSSCSIEVQQPVSATPSPEFESPPAAIPSVAGSADVTAISTTNIPVTWADLNLSGELIYTNGIVKEDVFHLQIESLDLASGDITTIFNAPKYSWVYYIAVSPDGKQLLMSYSPPPGDNVLDQDIYIMPLDGSAPPRLLFEPPAKDDDYIEVEWLPDGKYVYFTHVNYQIPPEEGQLYPFFQIFRMALPDGQPEKIAEKAFWPRLSPDSSHITYVSYDPFSRINKIYLADADGGNAHEVVLSGPFHPDTKDAPVFSPDGQSILFSGEIPVQSYQPNWFDKLTGVLVAKAHGNVVSDWWSVPVSGGEITRLTNIQTLGLFGSIAPDREHMASYSINGIFVMKLDGSELTSLLSNPQGVPGTLSWIP